MKKGLMRLAVCCTCAVLAATMAGSGCSVKSSNISADSGQSAYSSVSQSTGEESLPVESTAEESTTESPSGTSEESTGTDSTTDSQSDISSGDSQSDDSSVTDSTTSDSTSSDSQSSDSSTGDSQSTESSTGDSTSGDSQSSDSSTGDSQSSDSSTGDSQSTDSSTGDSQSTESSTGDSQSTESSTGDSQSEDDGGETGGDDGGKKDDTPDNISVFINISDIGVATSLEDGHELGTGVYIYSSGSDLAVASGKKAYNGTTFTYYLKTGADVTSAAIKIVATDACTVTLYAMSASEDEDREVGLFSTEFDPAGETQTIAGGTKIVELSFSIPAAGTYYLGSASKGINIYYIAVTY